MEIQKIIFRGKRIDNGEWAEGYYFIDERDIEDGFIQREIPQIQQRYGDHFNYFDIIPETVGQYTGLTDKNNRKIFEGDICKVGDLLYKVIFAYGQWYFDIISTKHICCPYFWSHCGEHCEVVGNIFDNTELIKE